MSVSIKITRLVGLGLVLVCGGISAAAQTVKEALVIYTKAGHVSQVTGPAMVRHDASDPGTVLGLSDDLSNGDVVATGADARVEVMLGPGAYLRLGDNSEIQTISTDLEDVRVILKRGSAVVQADAPDETFLIQMAMPSGTAVLKKHGLYHLNVAGKRSELLVMKGGTTIKPAMIDVKECKRVAITTGVAEPVAKFDPKTMQDALDRWSQDRAELLAKTNRNGMPAGTIQTAPNGASYAANGGNGGFSVSNNAAAKGPMGGPAPAVVPAGSAKGGAPATAIQIPSTP